MAKKMLIDATHEEETRVVVVEGNKLEEYDFETASKRQLKGNIYLASVTRVEPSLQAAFVEYGGNRQGFLPFNEIHPDYYQIPAEDKELLEQEEAEEDDFTETDEEAEVEEIGGDESMVEDGKKNRPRLKRHYKIQEVIKKRQVILIQVLKEERGNKGAAVTTYLSLAGRYCVLMPNTSRGGGVSRKITNQQDRKRLKGIFDEMDKPEGMGVIIRTAGEGRSKLEIKRDYEYTFNLWDKIRDLTLKSIAPALINEESSLIHRAIRDIYNKDIDEVIVTGDKGYKTAKAYMKELTPSHAKKVQQYKEKDGIPLFQRYQVETQISHIYDHQVNMPSGGSIVINQTEALVAIDVNSGRSIKGRSIDETAVKTNLEAAEEIARQLRLRDMAGLVVIDFIDMEDNRSNMQVEKKLKEALRGDRARIKVGRISRFGLLEMSRQRLRASLIDATSSACPSCAGSGTVPSTEVASMMVLRTIEEEAMRKRSSKVSVSVPTDVGMYLLNNKRKALTSIEDKFEISVELKLVDTMVSPSFEMVRFDENDNAIVVGGGNVDWRENKKNNNNNNRNHNHNQNQNQNQDSGNNNQNEDSDESDNNGKEEKRFKKNRNKNRNNRRNKSRRNNFDNENQGNENSSNEEKAPVVENNESKPKAEEKPKKAKKSKAKKSTAKKSDAKKSSAKKSKAKKSKAKKSKAKKSDTKED
ncbi:MAG: Rne/Rng family ribonuclease [Alphaproteobacteria bacterium]